MIIRFALALALAAAATYAERGIRIIVPLIGKRTDETTGDDDKRILGFSIGSVFATLSGVCRWSMVAGRRQPASLATIHRWVTSTPSSTSV